MRARLSKTLITALLAPILLLSAGAQGRLFMRCDSPLRVSCCCPADAATAPASATVKAASPQCCDELAVPTVPAQTRESTQAVASPPLAASAITVVDFTPPTCAVRVPRLDPPPAPPIALVNCALLI